MTIYAMSRSPPWFVRASGCFNGRPPLGLPSKREEEGQNRYRLFVLKWRISMFFWVAGRVYLTRGGSPRKATASPPRRDGQGLSICRSPLTPAALPIPQHQALRTAAQLRLFAGIPAHLPERDNPVIRLSLDPCSVGRDGGVDLDARVPRQRERWNESDGGRLVTEPVLAFCATTASIPFGG